jgi:predicted RNA binding protein YcfA (HicA-like mRNA interferase family)
MDIEKDKWKPHIFSHPGRTEILSVPVHKNEDLKRGLQKKLMTIAGINDSDL